MQKLISTLKIDDDVRWVTGDLALDQRNAVSTVFNCHVISCNFHLPTAIIQQHQERQKTVNLQENDDLLQLVMKSIWDPIDESLIALNALADDVINRFHGDDEGKKDFAVYGFGLFFAFDFLF